MTFTFLCRIALANYILENGRSNEHLATCYFCECGKQFLCMQLSRMESSEFPSEEAAQFVERFWEEIVQQSDNFTAGKYDDISSNRD